MVQEGECASPSKDAKPAPPDESTDTPEEALHHAVQQLRDALEAEVLDRVRKAAQHFSNR